MNLSVASAKIVVISLGVIVRVARVSDREGGTSVGELSRWCRDVLYFFES